MCPPHRRLRRPLTRAAKPARENPSTPRWRFRNEEMTSQLVSNVSDRMRVILLGAPGSGKGTFAEFLTTHLNVPAISTGDLIRYEIKVGYLTCTCSRPGCMAWGDGDEGIPGVSWRSALRRRLGWVPSLRSTCVHSVQCIYACVSLSHSLLSGLHAGGGM